MPSRRTFINLFLFVVFLGATLTACGGAQTTALPTPLANKDSAAASAPTEVAQANGAYSVASAPTTVVPAPTLVSSGSEDEAAFLAKATDAIGQVKTLRSSFVIQYFENGAVVDQSSSEDEIDDLTHVMHIVGTYEGKPDETYVNTEKTCRKYTGEPWKCEKPGGSTRTEAQSWTEFLKNTNEKPTVTELDHGSRSDTWKQRPCRVFYHTITDDKVTIINELWVAADTHLPMAQVSYEMAGSRNPKGTVEMKDTSEYRDFNVPLDLKMPSP